MFRACIADDEKYVMESIRRRVEQAELSIEVVGTAENGREAYELYQRVKPDIFFVDIQMPLCSGLDFVERVRKLDANSETQFVIITGYEDFSYMKRAIKTNVVNYILKPIQKEEFAETLEEVCKNLEEIRKKKRDEFWNKMILYQDYPDEEKCFTGTALLLWKDNLLRKVKKEESSFSSIFPVDSWRYVRFHETENLLLLLRKTYYTEKEIYEVWEEIGKRINLHCIMVYKMAREEKFETLVEKMEITMNNRFWKKGFHIFRCEDDNVKLDIKEDMEDLESTLENVRENAWEPLLEKKFQTLFEEWSNINTGRLKRFYHNVLILTANHYTAHHLTIPDSLKEELSPFALEKCSERKEILEKIKVYMKMLHETLLRETEKDSLVGQAEEYIKRNYAKNITLTDLADELFVAPNYLAKKFKDKKKMTAMQYLESYRMEKAEDLLKNSLYNITEIADRCGYNDVNYFIRVFKKRYGISPRKYRDS